MKRFFLVAASIVASVPALAAAPASYTIVDLGADQQPLAVNASGTLVGFTISTHLPVSFTGGAWTPLPVLGTVGEALAVNAKGVSTGWDSLKQVEWKGGKRKALTGTKAGQGEGIADDGTVVGTEFGGSFDFCYKWLAGVKTGLGGLGGDGNCFAHAIDPTGAYIGGQSSTDSGDYHAFIVDASGTHDLGTLNGTASSSVKALNKHGHAAVWSTYGDSFYWTATYWNGSRLIDIGRHSPGVQSLATAINANDDVLVVGTDGLGHVLFLYSGRTRTSVPIEPLISNPAGWTFDYSDPIRMLTALGDDGTAYGTANFGGVPHAFKLVPANP